MAWRILALLAHPDDETFGPGGTIAKYSGEGVEVYLATATRGEEGMVGDPPVADRERLGEVRAGELLSAAKVLGVKEVRFLGFRDRSLADTSREFIVEAAVREIRRVRPHVMIGFGPEGVSRHPDHIVMSEVAMEAFEAAADPGKFPRAGAGRDVPWSVSKLYQFEVSEEIFARWGIPLRGVPPERLTTFVDTSAQVEKKISAFYCHRTQAKDYNNILSRDGYREFARKETYVLAGTRLPGVRIPETDLFAGIPDDERMKP